MLKVFESYSKEKEILDWLEAHDSKFDVKKYTISDSGVIDVDGNIEIRNQEIETLPYKFGYVSGFFKLMYCTKLNSLVGCPIKVGGDFWCTSSSISTLEGCVKHVDGYFYVSHNDKLNSLVGGPTYVGGDYNCNWCSLKNLIGAPTSLDSSLHGNFACQNNMIVNLEGAPRKARSFTCNNNDITSFYGAPIELRLNFKEKFQWHGKYENIMDLHDINREYVDLDELLYWSPAIKIFGEETAQKIIIPNLEEFNDGEIIYYEANRYYFNEYGFLNFIKDVAPGQYSLYKKELPKMVERAKENGYLIP
jgi:hypothetical protein